MNQYLDTAIKAARAAGALVRDNFGRPLKVNVEEAHDIKLELDVRSQALITELLLEKFPDHAILGEEGNAENDSTEFEWVIDPIDGTVNYFYGIPHFCISISLREKGEIIVGVIYDPMRDELWHAELDGKAYLNDKPIEVSQYTDISQSVVSVGMSKTMAELESRSFNFLGSTCPGQKVSDDGQRCTRPRLRRNRPIRCLHRTERELVGYRSGCALVNCASGRLAIAPSAIQTGNCR
jgi:fructose-1,6-bisphosphatase/inositol monophosphatase family enzyme